MIPKQKFTGPLPGRITDFEKKFGLYGPESKKQTIPERISALCKHSGFPEIASMSLWEKLDMVERRAADASEPSPIAVKAHENEVLSQVKKAEDSKPLTKAEARAKHPEFAAKIDGIEAIVRDAAGRGNLTESEIQKAVDAAKSDLLHEELKETQRMSKGELNPLLADAERRAGEIIPLASSSEENLLIKNATERAAADRAERRSKNV